MFKSNQYLTLCIREYEQQHIYVLESPVWCCLSLFSIRRHQERRAILTPILTDFSVRVTAAPAIIFSKNISPDCGQAEVSPLHAVLFTHPALHLSFKSICMFWRVQSPVLLQAHSDGQMWCMFYMSMEAFASKSRSRWVRCGILFCSFNATYFDIACPLTPTCYSHDWNHYSLNPLSIWK